MTVWRQHNVERLVVQRLAVPDHPIEVEDDSAVTAGHELALTQSNKMKFAMRRYPRQKSSFSTKLRLGRRLVDIPDQKTGGAEGVRVIAERAMVVDKLCGRSRPHS